MVVAANDDRSEAKQPQPNVLTLLRQPANVHDVNAISLWTVAAAGVPAQQVGYISRHTVREKTSEE